MKKVILEQSIFIIHGPKLDNKHYINDIISPDVQFLCVQYPDDLKNFSNFIFIFDAQLLQNASFDDWNQQLSDCVTISEHFLDINTELLLPIGFPKNETIKLLNFACQQLLLKRQNHYQKQLLDFEDQRLFQLNDISIALSKEKNLGVLLKKILLKSSI